MSTKGKKNMTSLKQLNDVIQNQERTISKLQKVLEKEKQQLKSQQTSRTNKKKSPKQNQSEKKSERKTKTESRHKSSAKYQNSDTQTQELIATFSNNQLQNLQITKKQEPYQQDKSDVTQNLINESSSNSLHQIDHMNELMSLRELLDKFKKEVSQKENIHKIREKDMIKKIQDLEQINQSKDDKIKNLQNQLDFHKHENNQLQIDFQRQKQAWQKMYSELCSEMRQIKTEILQFTKTQSSEKKMMTSDEKENTISLPLWNPRNYTNEVENSKYEGYRCKLKL